MCFSPFPRAAATPPAAASAWPTAGPSATPSATIVIEGRESAGSTSVTSLGGSSQRRKLVTMKADPRAKTRSAGRHQRRKDSYRLQEEFPVKKCMSCFSLVIETRFIGRNKNKYNNVTFKGNVYLSIMADSNLFIFLQSLSSLNYII